ncbi:MAG: alpha/beta hydrolase domain-containing protein [Bacteroidales bacterium]
MIDIEPLPFERIYMIASGQHYVGPSPGERNRLGGTDIYRVTRSTSVNYRSLLTRLASWVDSDIQEPPQNAYPRISDGTLVNPEDNYYPAVKDLVLPGVIHVAYMADYGPRWNEGIIDYQPPFLTKPFPSMVSLIDENGNDLAGIRNVEIMVPVATYFPWNLRTGFAGGEDELTDFTGTFIPLSRIKKSGYSPDADDLKTLYKDFSRLHVKS